ncbi:MAG: TetR/AcrR family transcriptional regulator [Solirubrobacteraceae bacterium]|jgi:AcrR family transcriptional regulator
MSKITVVAVSANPSPRRSQAERSAATRDALLDATIACLVDDGYANTTTSRVAERAGVSRGAHLHHFQTRQALVAAAMERLAERRGAELLAAAENLPDGRERLVQGLDLLWASYANPLFQAALDLWSHARTDADLRERLVPVERRLDRQTLEITRRLFPAIAEQPDFDRLIELAVSTIRGLALLDTLHPGDARNRKQWRYSRARLVELFEAAS